MLDGWCKVSLLKSEIAGGKGLNLERSFVRVFERAGNPEDAGLFGAKGTPNSKFFFSPGAEKIARIILAVYGGQNCSAPKRSAVVLLVGVADSKAITFGPESLK